MSQELEYAERLNQTIDKHTATSPDGHRVLTSALESHDLASLSKRICASTAVTMKLLGSGTLTAENPTHRGDDSRFAFRSDHLNDIKKAILTALVERIIDDADSLAEVSIATEHALAEYKAQFKKGAAKPETEFAASFPAGMVQLARDVYGRYEEDEPGTIRQAAGVAAASGAAYAGAAYLRGRAPGVMPFAAIRAGHAANKVTGRKIGAWFKPKAHRVAAAGAGFMDTAATAAKKAAGALRGRIG